MSLGEGGAPRELTGESVESGRHVCLCSRLLVALPPGSSLRQGSLLRRTSRARGRGRTQVSTRPGMRTGFAEAAEAAEAGQALGCIAINSVPRSLFSDQDVRASRLSRRGRCHWERRPEGGASGGAGICALLFSAHGDCPLAAWPK